MTLAVLAGVAVGGILVLLTWLIVLLTKEDSSRAANTQPPATAPPAAVATATVTETVAPKATPQPKPTASSAPSAAPAGMDVRTLPPGLFCRDLNAKGYSYVAAVEYWRLHGQPDQMDADRNGIPCETVYTRSAVAAYWNGREISGITFWPNGLYCRDLFARGASYGEAVRYWWYYGMPDRMDADKNGVPCETVYSAATVNDFWSP
ncbi:hypothetical protein [Kribbella sp. NPDC048915]|uniref:hypothetical protein n=1 Tax=Kribbella sp. NPDC048915 TaxID=3155148 RepID=UPI003410C129